jgi:hypothetical protein
MYRRLGKVVHVEDGGYVRMAAVEDFDELIEQYQPALGEFMKGNPETAMSATAGGIPSVAQTRRTPFHQTQLLLCPPSP